MRLLRSSFALGLMLACSNPVTGPPEGTFSDPGASADPGTSSGDPAATPPDETIELESGVLAALREIWSRTMISGVEEGAYFSNPPGAADVLVVSPIPTGTEAAISFDWSNVPPDNHIWGDAHTHPVGLGEHPPSFDDIKNWAVYAPTLDMTWRYAVDGDTIWAIRHTPQADQLYARSSALLPWTSSVRQYVRQRYEQAIEPAVQAISAADGRSVEELRATAMGRFDSPPEGFLAPGQVFGVMEAWLMARHGYLLIADWPLVTDGPVPNRLAQAEALTHQLRMDYYRGSMSTGVLTRIPRRTDLVRPTDTLLSWLEGAEAASTDATATGGGSTALPAYPCCIGAQVYGCDGWNTAFACLESQQTAGCTPVPGECQPGTNGQPGQPGQAS